LAPNFKTTRSLHTMSDPSVKPSDPAHPAHPNVDHTTKSGSKPETAVTAVLDSNFLPTLDGAPPTRYVQSFLILASIILGLAFLAYIHGLEVFQTTAQQNVIMGLVTFTLFYTGVVWIDWWELAVGYWWFTLPILAGFGVLLVRMNEAATGIDDVD